MLFTSPPRTRSSEVVISARALQVSFKLKDFVLLSCTGKRARLLTRLSMMCCVYNWEQHMLLLLHDEAAWTGLLVAVCAYTHASSRVLSP